MHTVAALPYNKTATNPVKLMENSVTSDKQTEELENCTFVKTVLMILVVLYHSCVFWSGEWFQPLQMGIVSNVLKYFSLWLNSFHVYTFTLVSGYIFSFLKCEAEKYRTFKPFLCNKVKRLLVPYFFLSVVWVIPIGQCFFHYDARGIILQYVLGTSPSQLWFLLMLFWCFLGAYWLNDVIHRSIWTSVCISIISFCVGLIGGAFFPNFFCLWTAFQFFPFFIFGMKIRQSRRKIKIPLYILIVLDLFLFILWCFVREGDGLFMKMITAGVGFLLHLDGALMTWSILQMIGRRVKWKENKAFITVSACSMPIYLFHQQIVYLVIWAFNGIFNPYLHAAVNFIAALGGGLIIGIIMKRWKVTGFLIGERS